MADMGNAKVSTGGDPASEFWAITPNDGTDLTNYQSIRGIYVGVGGTIVMDDQTTNTTISFLNVPSGSILPVRPKRIRSTSTTATNMLALI